MGEIALTSMAIANLGLFLLAGVFFNLWQSEIRKSKAVKAKEREFRDRYFKEQAAHIATTAERDELLRQKQSTQGHAASQQTRKPLTSAQARMRVDQSNSTHFSADKRVSNSEIVKENSNG